MSFLAFFFFLLSFSVPCLPLPISYPLEHFPEGNTTVFAVEELSYGGLFVLGLGKDGQLWSVYQQKQAALPWSNWTQLTEFCPSANETERKCRFDADPAIGKNKDGRLEIFARFHGNLDLWQMYQKDAEDPLSWTMPREPSCVDQDQETGVWWCMGVLKVMCYVGLCPKGNFKNECEYPFINGYWSRAPIFPTSDISVIHGADGRLKLFYRGFDAGFYMIQQSEPGGSEYYDPPVNVGNPILFV